MFVQHYLTNMFGRNNDEFLEQEMDSEEGDRGRGEMAGGREAGGVAVGEGGRRKRVGEVSRLVGYLGGESPAKVVDVGDEAVLREIIDGGNAGL